MVHGLLEDLCGELFVRRIEANAAESLHEEGSAQMSAEDAGAEEWHRGFQARALGRSQPGMQGLKPLTNTQTLILNREFPGPGSLAAGLRWCLGHTTLHSLQSLRLALSSAAWTQQPRPANTLMAHSQGHMQVDVAAVPPGISLATAEAVLFIGKAARVLRQPPGRPATNPGHRPCQALTSRASPAPQPSGAAQAGAAHGRAGRERAAGAGLWREAGSAGGEWEGMRQSWAAELRRLAAAPALSALDFERTVEGIHIQARQLP